MHRGSCRGEMLHCATRAQQPTTIPGGLARTSSRLDDSKEVHNVAKSRTEFYFVQCCAQQKCCEKCCETSRRGNMLHRAILQQLGRCDTNCWRIARYTCLLFSGFSNVCCFACVSTIQLWNLAVWPILACYFSWWGSFACFKIKSLYAN